MFGNLFLLFRKVSDQEPISETDALSILGIMQHFKIQFASVSTQSLPTNQIKPEIASLQVDSHLKLIFI